MSKKWKGIIVLCILLFLLIVMFLFSSQNGINTTSLSIKVTRVIARFTFVNYENMTLSQQAFIVEELNYFIRKVAHFIIYMLIGMCSFYAMLILVEKIRKKATVSVFFCFIYALSDEVHQFFVPGRDFKVTDILIDMFGVIIGILLLKIILIVIEYIKNNLKEQTVLKGR